MEERETALAIQFQEEYREATKELREEMMAMQARGDAEHSAQLVALRGERDAAEALAREDRAAAVQRERAQAEEHAAARVAALEAHRAEVAGE